MNSSSVIPSGRKIRVGFFGTRGLPARYGGFETIGEMLSKKLNKKVFELYVTQEDDTVRKPQIVPYTDPGTFKILFPRSFAYKLGSRVGNVFSESNMLHQCRKNPWNLDVILQCGSTPGFIMPNPKKWLNGPLVLWNPDGLEWRREKFPIHGRVFLWASTKRGIALSHAITLDSKSVANSLKSWIRDKTVYFLPSGADIIDTKSLDYSILKEFDVEKNEYYLLVARLAPENHISEILQWFTNAGSKKKLVVLSNIGNDKYSKVVKDIIQKDSGKIIYKGPLYDRSKVETLRYFAYAYFHGHSVGGTNPSLLESMAAGCPAICFDVPFNREVAGESGLYFTDDISFIKAINKIEDSQITRDYLSKKAVDIITGDYTWEFIVRLHEYVIMNSMLINKRLSKELYLAWLENSGLSDKLSNFAESNISINKEAG